MNSFRVAFTGSHSRSVTFAHIAKNLTEQGADVYFIMPGAKYRIKYLTDMGFDRGRILDLAEIDRSYDADALCAMEKFSRVTAAHMIMSDRLLSKKRVKGAYGYLCGVFKSVSKFITDNKIDIVFSEATWAYELAACSACEYAGAKFIVPHSVRIPEGRFGFFSGIFQDKLIRLNRAEKSLPVPAEFSVPQVPFQYKLFSNRNFYGFFRHLGRFLNKTAKDETEQSVFGLTAERVKRAVNIKMSGFDAMQTMPEADFVYMPLHVSPEASLDILGGFWQNQLELVRSVARSLPHGMVVAVREHPAGLGCRHFSFFRETAKLPNVVNISPYADGMELIKNAKAVVSVSGTACYEAAFVGVGSVVFSDVFFCDLPTVFRCRSVEDIRNILAEAMSVKYDEHALAEFLADITANSYAGCVDSADMNPLAIEKENARVVSQAFMDIIEYYSSSEKSL
ncbi:hypothetical protein [Seleniivibrio sp.]|uniref:hypothetical protein n=1 Tax=Seleniivibrio sp. TaxID=2898801 RepID=UPI0025CF0711|nr:hypothetical protein [Seleniivibrio sp.]MCD8554789.1 hypothetical protein [Seleniivibrio sp.]